ncbi:G-protein coupled receptor [Xylaria intraflava]|nr:G-protein coupled receptor [Xylaria intraflava]
MISPDLVQTLSIIERVGSVCSLAGCVFVIVTFLSSSAFRKPINNLIFYATLGNMLANIGTLIAATYIERQNSFGCQFQGFLIQQFLPSDALWAFAMSLNVYLTFYAKFDAKKLRRMEKWYLLFCYGLPLPAALSFLFISTKAKGRIYGDAVLWCWVSLPWDILQVATFYAPIWVIISATFFIYIRTGGEIFKKRRELHHMDYQYDFESFEMYATKTTEISVTSEPAAQDPSKTRNNMFLGPESKDTSGPQPSPTRSITISSARDPSNPPLSPISPMSPMSPMPPTVEGPRHAARTKSKRKVKNTGADSAAWAYTKCAILFFTALLVTWIPSSANRVYSLVHGGENSEALLILAAIVLPLQGFWNGIIYMVTSWAAVKLFFRELVHHTRPGNSSPNYLTSPQHRQSITAAFTNPREKGEDSESMTGLTGISTPPKSA